MMIEVDENQHTTYDCSCENVRIGDLYMDVGCRPLLIVRFNPDAYVARDGTPIQSCWGLTKARGQCIVLPKRAAEWTARLEALRQAISVQLATLQGGVGDGGVAALPPVSVVHLFYDDDLRV